MDINDRDREDDSPGEPAERTPQPHESTILPRTDDVIAVIDRVEQGVEMRGGPWLARAGDQDEWRDRTLKAMRERLAPAVLPGRDDDGLDLPSPLVEQFVERMGHAAGIGPAVLRHHDDPDVREG